MGNRICDEIDYHPMLISWKDPKSTPRISEKFGAYGFENYLTNPSVEGKNNIRIIHGDIKKVYEEYLEKTQPLYKKKTKFRDLDASGRPFFKKNLISTINKEIIKLPQELSVLLQSIEKSKYILELKDNWDDEGAKPYSKYTWEKAIYFIVEYAQWVLANCGKVMIAPQIYHGPDGSIDLYWKNDSFNLLINIPEQAKSLGTFYGDDYNGQKIEGTFDPENFKPSLFPMLIN